MDYRPITVLEINDLISKFKDYTIGEIIYTIQLYTKKMGRDLLNISDKELYTIINNIEKYERE